MSQAAKRRASCASLFVLVVVAVLVNIAPALSHHRHGSDQDLIEDLFENGSSVVCEFENGIVWRTQGELLKEAADPGPVLPGSDFSYQIDVIASSNAIDGFSARLVDALPAQLLFSSVADSNFLPDFYEPYRMSCEGPPAGSSGNLTCVNALPGEFAVSSIDVFGQIDPTAVPGTLTNTAVLSMNGTVDGAAITCTTTSTSQVEIISPANLTATKTVSGDFVDHGQIVYLVVLSNAGPATQVDATGDEFSDTLPSGLQLDCGPPTEVLSGGGTLLCDANSNTVTWNGSIAANESVSIEIGATVLPSAAGTTIANQGTIRFDADGDGAHDTNGTTDDPRTVSGPDPTLLVISAKVPAAGAIALVAFAVLLVIAAMPRARG